MVGGKQASDALELEGGAQGCPCLRSSEERLCRSWTPSAEKGRCLAGVGTSEGMCSESRTGTAWKNYRLWAKGSSAGEEAASEQERGISLPPAFQSFSSSLYWQPNRNWGWWWGWWLGVGWEWGVAGEKQCAESQPSTHHKATHRKVGLQLHNQLGALFSEDGLMGGHFPDRHKELQKVVGLSYSPCTRVFLESPRLLSQFFTFDRS